MATTKEEIDRFHRFALEQLARLDHTLDLDQLLIEWYDSQDRHFVNSVIRQGLADIDAGLGREAHEVMEGLRQKHQLANDRVANRNPNNKHTSWKTK